MSINVSNYHDSDSSVKKLKNNDATEKKQSEIKLFSNQKVASDINNISAKYGTANFDDAREYAALGNYLEQFKAYLSDGVQRFLNGILNKTTSYTAEQIQEMASHTDKATADRVLDSVQEFAGTMEILSMLQSCKSDDEIKPLNAEQLWANAKSKTDKATAERTENFVKALSNIEPGTLEIIGLISD